MKAIDIHNAMKKLQIMHYIIEDHTQASTPYYILKLPAEMGNIQGPLIALTQLSNNIWVEKGYLHANIIHQ